MDNLTSEYFNLGEGIFWLVLGLACIVIYSKIKMKYASLALYSAAVLIAFGISDFFQVVYGSFLMPGMEWLLVWKILNVIALCSIFPCFV